MNAMNVSLPAAEGCGTLIFAIALLVYLVVQRLFSAFLYHRHRFFFAQVFLHHGMAEVDERCERNGNDQLHRVAGERGLNKEIGCLDARKPEGDALHHEGIKELRNGSGAGSAQPYHPAPRSFSEEPEHEHIYHLRH